MCSLPNGIRTGPVTSDVVADSRDQPNIRARGTNAGTVTTTHGPPGRIAGNALAVPVPSTCEAAQPPKPLTIPQIREQVERSDGRHALKATRISYPVDPARRRDLYQQAKNTIETDIEHP